MKERGDELTNQANSFSLEGRGSIMPDGTSGPGVEGPQPEPQDAKKRREATDEELAGFNAAVNKAGEAGGDGEKRNVQEAFNQFLSKERGDPDRLPKSFEDLIEKIMDSADEQWKLDGDKALMRQENGEMVVNKENFVSWVRERMIWLHEFNPTSEVNFFSDINVKVGYAQISFYEMIFTGSYFLQRKVENGRVVGTQKNKDYEAIKEQLINEAFLFSNSRNNDVKYKSVQSNEQKLPELLSQIYAANPFLRGEFMQKILTMSSFDSKNIDKLKTKLNNPENFEDNKIESLLKENSDVGEGIRRSLLAYYHIQDVDMLTKILGEKSAFFTETFDEYDKEKGTIKKDENGKDVKVKGKANQDWSSDETSDHYGERVEFDKDGNIKSESMENFLKYVNIFNAPKKDERIIEEVRERIRQSIMKQTGLSYSEAKYAESWAFSMTKWTGIGARNDTTAAAFDAWSKPLNLLQYRLKQLEGKRRGVYGNIFNLAGIKRAGLTMFEGITDIHGRSVIEAVQGGQGGEFSDENPFKDATEENKKDLKFGQNMGSFFMSNHVGNSFKIYDFIINHTDFNIESMVTYDAFGRPIIDQKKANEVIDGIQKAIRYAYCTWDGTDYNKNIRVLENKEMKEMPVLAAMFGPDIIKLIKNDIDKRGKYSQKNPNKWEISGDEAGKFEMNFADSQTKENREMLWKSIMQYMVAQEIHSHRSRKSELSRYGYDMTEKIYDFLRVKGLADGEEIKEMRKMSNTTLKSLALEDFSKDVSWGALKGFWRSLQIMLREIMK